MAYFNLRGPDGHILTQEEYELQQFSSAQHYKVSVRVGPGKQRAVPCRTYPEALMLALYTPQSNIYAMPDDKMTDILIPRKKYEYYLGVYNKLTGQKLKMPKDPFAVVAKREEPVKKRIKRERLSKPRKR